MVVLRPGPCALRRLAGALGLSGQHLRCWIPSRNPGSVLIEHFLEQQAAFEAGMMTVEARGQPR